jgi:hypothetical protein
MRTLMIVLTIANVAQAIIYHRLEGKFQTMFWCLAAAAGLLSFV